MMTLAEILIKYRKSIIIEWVHRLHTEVSPRYNERPREELFSTVSKGYDAGTAFLVDDDYSVIDAHIEWITRIRLEGGFLLSDVQNAYDLYRICLVPILVKELEGMDLLRVLLRLNTFLLYTIKKFSNFFQSLHEKEIRDHAENLSHEVDKRTKELSESEAKYRVLVEEIDDGYFVNQNGRIVFANQAFGDLHGWLPHELIGKPYTDLVAPKSLPMVKKIYEKRMVGEETRDLYVYLRLHKDGFQLPTENKIKKIFYQGEEALAGICRDITRRMETEKRIRESERLAHIGQLTTSLAHEIRNPLSSVKMNSQIILKNSHVSGNDQRRMEIIVQEISRLEKILDEMLDFAKPVKLHLESTALNGLLDDCLEIMEARIKEKELVVTKRYARKLPRIMVDRGKMEQVIINVLLNSIEVLAKGGRLEVFTQQRRKDGPALLCEISDDGPGISPEDLPYVFDPFFSNKKKGTGLGLSNVKKIIEAHGGTANLFNRKPRGTLVGLTLPLGRLS